MQIDFPNAVLPKVTALGTVSFQARVDGEYLWCEISREALRMHFGAASMQDDELLNAFCRGKDRIEQATRHHLELDGSRAVLLMVQDF
jgi:hypothetical protein